MRREVRGQPHSKLCAGAAPTLCALLITPYLHITIPTCPYTTPGNKILLYCTLNYNTKPNTITHAYIAHMLNATKDTLSVRCSIVVQIVRVE